MVALEPLDRALARGARVYAEIVGWSGNADIAIDRGRDPTGDGLAACMKEALAYGQLGPEKIDLVAAAGLSHPQLDAIEARAIEQVFGRLPVSVAALSTRFGTCAATPVVSLAAVGLGMFHGFTPWARSGFAPGEEAEGRLALQTAPLKQSPRGAIVNAISPGGTNYSLVLERPCP
jgi:3-oxoacyl-[acyl-carrier-protein] synthase II